MANGFSKEEIVMFDNVLEGFQDALVVSKMATVVNLDKTTMERTNDTIWFPMPYIMTSYSGNDATSNFKDVTQLSVPGQISNQQYVPWILTARQLRDAQQEGRLTKGATQKLSSDININVMNTAALYGSLAVKVTTAATGFVDIAAADTLMTTQGVPRDDRKYGIVPLDYNGMAANLASRTLDNSKSLVAYEKAMLGEVAGFDTYKMDYGYRLTAALGVTVTITNSSPLFYTPAATAASADGLTYNNVDNRFQTISIAVTSGTVKAGDIFTIAGVNACHHIAKQDTGQLKTFRVVSIVTGAGGTGTVKITPPIISNGGSTNAEAQYQNVTATPTNGAAITFLNTVAAPVNTFWQGDAMQILPGRLMPRADSGMAVMEASTDQGFQLVMTRQGEINQLQTRYRLDAIWGSFAANTEMMGVEMFNQT